MSLNQGGVWLELSRQPNGLSFPLEQPVQTGAAWLQRRVAALSARTSKKPRRVEVRDLGFRWRSCGRNEVLFFNWKVLQVPVRLLDYVIVHEWVHLVEGHHGPAFWAALGRTMPDWPKRKDALVRQAKEYLIFGLLA